MEIKITGTVDELDAALVRIRNNFSINSDTGNTLVISTVLSARQYTRTFQVSTLANPNVGNSNSGTNP